MTYRKQLYRQYLQTDDWKLKADRAKGAADFRCQAVWNGERCRNRATQIHHRHYISVFDEWPDDLMAVCGDCHCRFHNITRKAANDNQLALPLEM